VSTLSTIESLAVIVGVILVVIQINLQVYRTRKDRDRKKRQTTFEFYFSYLKDEDAFLGVISNILKPSKKCKVTFKVVTSKKAPPEWEKTIEQYLTRLELLALGVASDTYDFETLRLMCGDFLIEMYDSLEDYIIGIREKEKSDTFYAEFEFLVKRLKQYREKNPKEILGKKYLTPETKPKAKKCTTALANT